MTEVGKAFLEMKRHGIINGTADFLLGQRGLHRIPFSFAEDSDHKLMIDMMITQSALSKRLGGKNDAI